MNLTISGHHLEVTPALREYVVSKLDRVTRHFDQVVDINVLLTVEKQKEKERRQRAEVTLHVKGRDLFCEQSHEDLYAAIDQLMDKLDRQVCRHKEMMQEHGHATANRLFVSDSHRERLGCTGLGMDSPGTRHPERRFDDAGCWCATPVRRPTWSAT
jgi:putative sigma-54 modulation protein